MTFSISNVATSLAAYLAPVFPGVTFYEDPNQQDSETPCMFLQQTYSVLEKQIDGRWKRIIGLDLTYLVDYNLPNLQQLYEAAAEQLDLVLDTFPYVEDSDSTLLRAYEREWRIDLDAMHYKFEIRPIVYLDEPKAPMQKIEDYTQGVTTGSGN